jgi:acyl dehydratase
MGAQTVSAEIAVGLVLPEFCRITEHGNWNRYAAVNDEFIDVHMSADAAKAAGQPDIFGMGNLRVAYAHNALYDWLGDAGDIVSFSCQFRALNFIGDTLRTHAVVTGESERDGCRIIQIDLGVRNQQGDETMPGTAEVIIFDGDVRMPGPPTPVTIPSREPGVHLDEKTLSWLGRSVDPLTSLPVDANDIRRWAMATYYPELPPVSLVDLAVASDGPWGGLVAPRDFNPFAWVREFRPEAYPWMRGMGTEPGGRGLNGGQRSTYFAPIRPGDEITCVATLVDAYEKEGKLGTMLFLVDESRWINQAGELVKVGMRTSIYY